MSERESLFASLRRMSQAPWDWACNLRTDWRMFRAYRRYCRGIGE